jgi:hypothetical protein
MRLIRFFPCLPLSLAGLLMPLPSAPAQLISREAAVDHVATDRTVLLEGVQEIAAPGAPGGITAFGAAAFAVIGGKDGKSLGPVVAATRFEKGRVVAFGHNGYFGTLAEKDTGTLFLNAARWAATPAEGKVKQKLRIAVLNQEGLAAWLKEKGFQTESVSGEGWQRRIAGADVLCCDAHDLRSGREGGLDDLTRYVKSGGGLIIAATGWGWESGAKGKSLASDFAGNQLLAPMGLVFNNSTPDKTTGDGFRAGSDLALADASHALAALLEKPAKTDAEKQAQISATLGLAVRSVPPADPLFRSKLEALKKASGSAAGYPTPKRPLGPKDSLARLLFTMEVENLHSLPPDKTPAHPGAADFPGKVPAHAPRITKKLSLDTAVSGWQSLGLYAAPGQMISLTSPASVTKEGYKLRIGSHNDSLWHKEKWPRSPDVCRSTPVASASTTLANAFGGLVYIEVPDNQKGLLEFTLAGAVEAPLFVLGKTTDDEWKTLRQAPGPWAELACPGVILTVPSDSIRQLRNPTELMEFWNQIVAAEDWLASTEEDRSRPERIVADVEISAGYMHSGYPIMTYLDVVPMISDLNAMRRGSWGHFHELGHNHQQDDWTPDGTGEVTCNIFTLYVFDKVCGIPVEKAREGFSREEIRQSVRKHLAAGGTFEHWKSDAFLSLILYVQLQQEFGWETFRKVFAGYKNLPTAERPQTDAAKHEQFMIRFSTATGKNLAPFFQAWGLPISSAAAVEVASLPGWMPEDWPR